MQRSSPLYHKRFSPARRSNARFGGKRKLYAGIAVIGVLIGLVGPCAADIYMRIDDNGVIHFTNVPTSSKYRVYIKERPKILAHVQSPSHYDPIIQYAAKKHGLSFALVKSVIKVESNFNPRAVSKKGARGLMQIMPDNFKLLNISNAFDPRQNIMAGSSYLRQMMSRFGEVRLALAAYNAGPTAVMRYNNSIPPYAETERYVQRVMKYYYLYKKG